MGSREGSSCRAISCRTVSCRTVRLSVRHFSGLIYDAVDDFVIRCGGRLCKGTKPNGTSEAQPLLWMRMRFKPEAPSPDRSYVNFLAKSALLAKSELHAKSESALTLDDLCRQRNLANATSTHSSVAIQPRWAAVRPIDGGLVGCGARHLQLHAPYSNARA